MMTIGYIFLALVVYIASWFWASTLICHAISHACNRWWLSREAYRKRIDADMSDFMDEKVGKIH